MCLWGGGGRGILKYRMSVYSVLLYASLREIGVNSSLGEGGGGVGGCIFLRNFLFFQKFYKRYDTSRGYVPTLEDWYETSVYFVPIEIVNLHVNCKYSV